MSLSHHGAFPPARHLTTPKLALLLLAICLPWVDSLPAQAPAPTPGPLGNWSATDPTTSADQTNQFAAMFTLNSSGANCAPGFSNDTGFQFTHNYLNGWNQSDGKAKLTFSSLSLTANGQAQGQRIPFGLTLASTGMGDALGMVVTVTQSGGVNASGDEGTSGASWQVHQASGLSRGKIQKVFQAAINTTLTNAIVPQTGTQIVQIQSTAGLAVGNWIIIDPQTYDDPRQEAAQVTALTATSFSANILRSHAAGAQVLGAVVLNLQCGAGQGRLLVNLSQPSYPCQASCSGGGSLITGVGTAFQTAGLAGSTPVNLGAISFAADDQTQPPFSTGDGRLRDWYPIVSLQSDTSGHLLQRQCDGKGQYQGQGKAAGPAELRPAAIVMAISPVDNPQAGKVVLSANSFTWAVGDLCECAISPSIDMTPLMLRYGTFSEGGNYASALNLFNDGLQPFQNGLLLNGDSVGTNYGVTVAKANTGIKITYPGRSAMELNGDSTTAINWNTSHGTFAIVPDPTTKSLLIQANGVTALRIDNQGVLHGSIVP